MNYLTKYKQLVEFLNLKDISNDFPECNDFEKIIILLRQNGWTYGDIQKNLGMPPKKEIRNVLLKWAPELIDNSKSKIINVSTPYSEIYNILSHTDKKVWCIFGDNVELYIKDNKIYYDGDLLDYYTETEHNQILNEIKDER